MASVDRNNKMLLDLVRQPGNNTCADCGIPEPDWASYTLGIFVCLNCSGIHRNLSDISKVKSIRLDFWDDSLVQFMRERGNSSAKAIYEKCVPAFFYRPQHKDCVVLKDQWIRAKYERREFTGENYPQQAYCSDLFESTLWKKGKDNKQFLKRSFLLSRKDFTLRYFIKEDSKLPKAVISMKDFNAVFQPEKISHAHGLQISYMHDKRTRNLFVYHEKGQVIVSLFNALRATRLAYLQKKHPTLQDNDLVPQITGHCLKEGYMEKTGPTRESFKKRMLLSWVPSSLARRATATPLQRAAGGAREEAGGTAASRCTRRTGSSSSCASRSRSRRSGWRPSGRSSLNL
ncbi:arf-GAP with dual PH domain-containing protein 2-like isoform X4 [Cyclopterus lumpus]|uniref:arf-GAP with dual PH domain-containing protein 2-like isoform X4 n=1 Tax=Cyclopterus lumpus TaxID=8103 RepID=UPI001487159A|nr:arf-GAP with dual PH domain-containing protein 2-like isoform X4 [Cyclopterus lumpus]